MKNIPQFQKDLLNWYEQNKRDLPWRKNKNPYSIWISEVMLQQTKVDTVIPYFDRFMDRFPTIQSLAEAEEQDVLKLWEGLGYYSRARNLHKGAKQIVSEYNGVFPKDIHKISSIKGIGPYTAGAVSSIAFGKAEPAIDGNVLRVYARLFSVWEDISKTSAKKTIEAYVRKTIDKKDPSSFNQGIMEIGALICTPKNPKCETCPLHTHCKAYEEHSQGELPVKSKKKEPKIVEIAAVVLQDEEGRFLIHKRPSEGLLANLWEFPNTEGANEKEINEFLKETFGVQVNLEKTNISFQHIFTHLKWNITVYKGTVFKKVKEKEDSLWVKEKELNDYPFPVSHQKIKNFYKSS